LPFFRCRFAVPVSRFRTPLPLPLPLPLRISMPNGTDFLTYQFLQNKEFYNGRTAKRQRMTGNGMVETGHNSDATDDIT